MHFRPPVALRPPGAHLRILALSRLSTSNTSLNPDSLSGMAVFTFRNKSIYLKLQNLCSLNSKAAPKPQVILCILHCCICTVPYVFILPYPLCTFPLSRSNKHKSPCTLSLKVQTLRFLKPYSARKCFSVLKSIGSNNGFPLGTLLHMLHRIRKEAKQD